MSIAYPTEIAERLKKLQDFLCKQAIDLAIFTQNADLYYYTGTIQPLYLIVPVSGNPTVIAKKAITRICEEAPYLNLETFNSSKDLAKIISHYPLTTKKIGFTTSSTSYATITRWLQLIPEVTVVDLTWEIRLLRMIKSETEVAIQAKAGKIIAEIFQIAKGSFEPGQTELELSTIVESFMRLNGHGGLVRCRREGMEMGLGVCTSGINSLAGTKFDGVCTGVGICAAMPYGASHKPIQKGDPVLLDYAFNLEGYHVDQTRMFCLGKPAEPISKAYQAMVQIEQEIINQLIPGKLWNEIYESAVKMATKLGYETEFMGLETEKVSFVGHGVGLELDEPPLIAPKMDYKIAENMVIAIEPKVMLPEIGVVGIEDTIVVRTNKSEVLTTYPPDFIIWS